MLRLLLISDGVASTGLARVAESFLARLPSSRYEIHHLATNYQGDPHSLPWKVYRASAKGDIYGINRVQELAKRLRPDIILLLNDPWVMAQYIGRLSELRHRPLMAVWVIVESTGMDADWVADYYLADCIVSCNTFGKEQLRLLLGSELPIHIIPFGVDSTMFCPLGVKGVDGALAKEKIGLFGPEEARDSFVVLNAHRNQPRKRIDLTLKSFSIFARDKPENVKLYLHMGIEDSGWNIVKLAKRFGIEDRLVVSNTGERIPAVSDTDLNLIYNACDVGLNTACCEGWGLPIYEHASACKPQVMPGIPSLTSEWDGHALLIPPIYSLVMEHLQWDCFTPDEGAVAAALESLYLDHSLREFWGAKAAEKVRRPEYDWSAIVLSWDKLFEEALHNR